MTWRQATTAGPESCLGLLRWMTCPDPEWRVAGAGGLGDQRMFGSLDVREGRALAWVAVWAAVVETGWYPEPPRRGGLAQVVDAVRGRPAGGGLRLSIRRAFLGSLWDLTEDGWVPVGALDLLESAIDRTVLPADEAELLDHVIAARSRPSPTFYGDDDERPRPEPTPAEELPNLAGVGPGESLGPRAALDVVRGLVHVEPSERVVAADALGWAVGGGGVDDDEAAVLGVIASWAVVVEEADARPALLAALDVLARRDRVPPWALEQVLAHLAAADLDAPERSLRESLAAALAAHRDRAR